MGLVSKEIEIFGKKIKIETGKMAKQADGSAMVTCEGTSILATVVASDDLRPVDFLPLTVDVEEKLYAAGKIPGSFFRREGRPTDMATLTARIIDRTLRPTHEDWDAVSLPGRLEWLYWGVRPFRLGTKYLRARGGGPQATMPK